MYTKGEWKADKLNSFRYTVYPEGKDNSYIIAEVNSGVSRHTKIVPNEGEANARLIAKSPRMYEALDIMIKHFRTLDKLYSKDLEVLNIGSRAIADD